eukprot:1606109-Pyramimonas_sp.AAC.1
MKNSWSTSLEWQTRSLFGGRPSLRFFMGAFWRGGNVRHLGVPREAVGIPLGSFLPQVAPGAGGCCD